MSEEKGEKGKGKEDSKSQPKGGYDSTPLPKLEKPGYTLKFTFHSCKNLPISDFGSRSCDPYLLATLLTDAPKRHKEDSDLRFRTPTVQRTTAPTFNTQWIVADVPASGFNLKIKVMDEDPGDYDDRLGDVHVHSGPIDENYKGFSQQTYKIKKSKGSWRAYSMRFLATLCDRHLDMHGEMTLSIENLGRTEGGGRPPYTIGPLFWVKHFSPLIGRMAGTKNKDDSSGTERFDFEANQMQLRGPVPGELYHRFVEFKSFVKGMFSSAGLRGKTLHYLLHHQHNQIYNYDAKTQYGEIDEPSEAMSKQFLKMVHYDEGGRIFTYVITLDGKFRFTETGKEFGIDLLSKHTMHADVACYIACSGEFFVRRLARPSTPSKPVSQEEAHPAEPIPYGTSNNKPPTDPRFYELIIDNDSGTYRPKADLLPLLQEFLKKSFVGLKVVAMRCDDEKLGKMKDAQRKTKRKEGDTRIYAQGSDSGSISSSDEEDLAERANRHEAGDDDAPQGFVGKLAGLADPSSGITKWAEKNT